MVLKVSAQTPEDRTRVQNFMASPAEGKGRHVSVCGCIASLIDQLFNGQSHFSKRTDSLFLEPLMLGKNIKRILIVRDANPQKKTQNDYFHPVFAKLD